MATADAFCFLLGGNPLNGHVKPGKCVQQPRGLPAVPTRMATTHFMEHPCGSVASCIQSRYLVNRASEGNDEW
jgi:hypothetical protein